MFIKIKVELLGQLLVLLMHLRADLTNFTFSAVVKSAVEKNKLHVLHEVLNFLVLVPATAHSLTKKEKIVDFVVLALTKCARKKKWLVSH